jgi:hypothetical protein
MPAIEVKDRLYNYRTTKNHTGFAAIVSRRQADIETLLYRVTFPTRRQAQQAARQAAHSFAANDAYLN